MNLSVTYGDSLPTGIVGFLCFGSMAFGLKKSICMGGESHQRDLCWDRSKLPLEEFVKHGALKTI